MQAEQIPIHIIPEITDIPLIWRYFVSPLPSVLHRLQLDEKEFVARTVMDINTPVMRRPSREMTAEMAHPERMRISPSRFIIIAFFPKIQKELISRGDKLPTGNELLCSLTRKIITPRGERVNEKNRKKTKIGN